MTKQFLLPDLGEGVHEAEILSVEVSLGQSIKEGDTLLEAETDKAVVEIPSPITGVIAEIHIAAGDVAKVGDALIGFTVTDDDKPGANAKAGSAGDEIRPTGKGLPVPASPSTRRLARELGVDLQDVTPTGKKGLVTADDVRNAASSDARQPDKKERENKNLEPAVEEQQSVHLPVQTLPDFSLFGPVERKPFRSIRRATAQRMTTSWSQIPHVNCQDVADVTSLEDFRQRHKEDIREEGGRLTMTVFAMKAIATALKTYPVFNASLDLANQEIIVKQYYHIGVAVDTPHGLVVPVIRDVDRKSIKELCIELHDIIGRAYERKLSREELIGGSFTITNAGAIGGSHFSAIINHPEIAILGMGQARMQPVVRDTSEGGHEIVPRLMMPMVLCFDHRVADGADAIRFMQLIIKALEDPDELLITMI